MQQIRPLLFRIIAVLLPLAVLICVDFVWQMVAPNHLFMTMPGQPNYQVVNPDYAPRYFRGFKPQVAFNPILQDKPADGFRIVALGGSSTAGYPYHFYHAFPERLTALVRAQYPVKTVEVVNLGMTAVNSHVIRDITPAVARLEPDAVLIYAGHNEYYGAYGTGTGAAVLRQRAGLKRLTLILKRSQLFRALEGLFALGNQADRTMMARSVGDAHIVEGSPAYDAGLHQFEANMAKVLGHFRKRDIPVYIGTVVSNLAGQSPLGEDALAISAYRAARNHLSAGDSVAAHLAFTRARALDPVRFRAPEPINQSIRRLADEWDAQLVELAPLFAGLDHDSLFTDHLHPTYRGHQRIADAFGLALSSQLSDGISAFPLDPQPDLFEQAHADMLIERLKGGFPFTRELTPEQEWANFTEYLEHKSNSGFYADSLAAAFTQLNVQLPEALLTASSRAQIEGDSIQALRFKRALLYWQPYNQSVKRSAVSLAGQMTNNVALAGEVVQLAVAISPDVDMLNTLAAIRIRQARLTAASRVLQAVEAQAPNSPIMLFNTARLLVMQGDTTAAQGYFARYQEAAAEASF